MATPRSPFKEQIVNRSRSVSPIANHSALPSASQEQHDNDSNDENTVLASFSYSPSKRGSNSNPMASVHSAEKSQSLDASTIAALRIQSILDVASAATSSFVDDEDQNEANQNAQVDILPPASPPQMTSVLDTPLSELLQNFVDTRQQQQGQVMNIFSAENPFQGSLLDSLDSTDIEQKHSAEEIIKVETVTSQGSEEEANSSHVNGVDSVELFDVTSEDVVDVPTADDEMEKDVFKPSTDETALASAAFLLQNPFEHYHQTNLSQGSEESYIFTRPASADQSDEAYGFSVPSKKSPVVPELTLHASSDAFSGVESNVDDEHDSGASSLKSQSESSDDPNESSAPVAANTDDKSAVLSCQTNDTYGRLSSATDKTPKINNMELQSLLNLPSPVMTPPMTPKQRYLAAVKASAGAAPRGPLTPKDRYLLAVRQAAAKCKTMVSTPKEIVTGPNLTPKSSVKAQIKRVEGRRDNSDELRDESNGVLFISSSPDRRPSPHQSPFHRRLLSPGRSQSDDEEDEQAASEFGSAMFENEQYNSPTKPSNVDGLHSTRATRSAFHSYLQSASHSTSGELPVREQIDAGSNTSPAKSYLQLDLEATPKPQVEDNDSLSSPQSNGLGPIDALRTSLAVIWNSKPIPRLPNDDQGEQQKSEASRRRRPAAEQYGPVSSPPAKANASIDPADTATKKRTDACCEVPAEAGAGAMESLRSSLMMIWNSKPKPKLLSSGTETIPNELQSPKADPPGFAPGSTTKDVESQAQQRPSRSPRGCGALPDCKRERVFSEDSDASSYRRTQTKKTRRSNGLSASIARQTRVAMGGQYLTTSQRGRSASREWTVTPIPSDEDLYDPGLLGDRGSYDSPSHSIEDCPIETKCASDLYRDPPRYPSTPSPVRRASTTETEDSFINAALKARNVDDVVVIYSGTPDKRDWHPPEQERKEHDTMVRAILERPSLIDKSIRESHQPSYWDWRQVRKWILIGLAMVMFIATIAACLACGITGACGRNDAKESQEVEEVQPLVLNLPLYTQESLKSLHTAQTKAYFWLESDPNRNTYSEARKMQRFALATLYYSTKIAQNWTASTSWLSYDIHECYWFSSYEGMDVCEDDQIKHLVLKKNNLRGNIPPELALMTSLVELDLSHNVLIGPIPEQLEALTSLEALRLEKNELNGNIPAQISSLTSLTSLALATNDLKGTIPSEVGMMTGLKKLRLFYNYLTGPVPTELGLLRDLEILDVDVNHLSGTIPSHLGQLERLEELWLDWNNFVGPIPSELGLLNNLVKLYLGRAFVEDELRDDDWRGSGDYVIPTELGQLSNLQELYLDNNNLTGMIPRELSSLTNLQRATLDNNLLTDSISPGICALFGGELESLSIDCSEVLCSCGCTCV